MKPGTTLRCKTTGRPYTVVTKRKHRGRNENGVKMIHLDGGVIKMSIRLDLLDVYFEAIT